MSIRRWHRNEHNRHNSICHRLSVGLNRPQAAGERLCQFVERANSATKVAPAITCQVIYAHAHAHSTGVSFGAATEQNGDRSWRVQHTVLHTYNVHMYVLAGKWVVGQGRHAALAMPFAWAANGCWSHTAVARVRDQIVMLIARVATFCCNWLEEVYPM